MMAMLTPRPVIDIAISSIKRTAATALDACPRAIDRRFDPMLMTVHDVVTSFPAMLAKSRKQRGSSPSVEIYEIYEMSDVTVPRFSAVARYLDTASSVAASAGTVETATTFLFVHKPW